jgi:nucleoside-diphosphate-sugar epimerase
MPSSDAKKAVLLTGAGGFTGRYLELALLQRGYRVSRLDSGGSEPCDLTDRAAVERTVLKVTPGYVVHLAAISFVAHGNAEDFYRVNVIGTLNLLHALARLDRPARQNCHRQQRQYLRNAGRRSAR